MLLQQKTKRIVKTVRRIPVKYYFVAGVLLVATVYVIAFRERVIAYNYGGETCINRLVLLPEIFKQARGETYVMEPNGGWSIFGKQVTATSLCIVPVEPPAEHSSESVAFAPWGGWLARLRYRIEAGAYPAIDTSALEGAPIAVSRELYVPLTQPDKTFSYQMAAEGNKAGCESMGEELACDVPSLKLDQGSTYTLKLEKRFKDRPVEAVSATVETLSPLTVTETSIGHDSVVYDKPEAVTITTDKPVGRAEVTVRRSDGEETVLESDVSIDGSTVTISFVEELPRQADIEIAADVLEAEDGSVPLDSFSLTFRTSGGPKVIGVNVGQTGVVIGAQIVVSFDQELSLDQDLGPFVATGGGLALQSRNGNQLVFSTSQAGLCQPISITLKPDISSPYGISGQSGWQYNGRTQCYTVTTIGYSSQGRPIIAYQFGGGGTTVMYTGAIHGNELSSKLLMERWIQELDANPGRIPADKRIIIVPAINPDGVAAGARVNARNVDLNRNFATGDWLKDIQHTNGSAFPGGGGEAPMSEPEVQAIANFVAHMRPALVLSYHSIGGMVISNQAGQANAKASQYANLSGYRLSGGDSGEFGYQITGTADDYYREKLGVASILIELGSHTYHQFERNQAAMWAAME